MILINASCHGHFNKPKVEVSGGRIYNSTRAPLLILQTLLPQQPLKAQSRLYSVFWQTWLFNQQDELYI